MENQENYNAKKYRTPDGLPTDIIIFTLQSKKNSIKTNKNLPDYELSVLMIKRKQWPFENCWAFPGGFSNENESLLEAAQRELYEETNISKDDVFIEQLKTYYKPGRDPRGWMPTVAFYTIVNESALSNRKAADDAKEVDLIPVEEALSSYDLAFDHKEILQDAYEMIKEKVLNTDIVSKFLPEEFTIGELFKVIQSIVKEYDEEKVNLIKKLTSSKLRGNIIEEVRLEDSTVKTSTKYSQRPAKLYKFTGDFQKITLF